MCASGEWTAPIVSVSLAWIPGPTIPQTLKILWKSNDDVRYLTKQKKNDGVRCSWEEGGVHNVLKVSEAWLVKVDFHSALKNGQDSGREEKFFKKKIQH